MCLLAACRIFASFGFAKRSRRTLPSAAVESTDGLTLKEFVPDQVADGARSTRTTSPSGTMPVPRTDTMDQMTGISRSFAGRRLMYRDLIGDREHTIPQAGSEVF